MSKLNLEGMSVEEANKLGLKTRTGNDVRIYALDGNDGHPVHGAYFQEIGWQSEVWRYSGAEYLDGDSETDLILPLVKPIIDWSKMPVDTLVEVTDDGDSWFPRHFEKLLILLDEDAGYLCFEGGATASTGIHHIGWEHIRLITNPPKPWFGGECPLPSGVKVKVWFRNDLAGCHIDKAVRLSWENTHDEDDIIAYQILGEEDDE